MYVIDGELVAGLPAARRAPDGTMRTGLAGMTDSELAGIGVYPATVVKPVLSEGQYYGAYAVEIEGDHATATYAVLDYSPAEIAGMLAGAKAAKKQEIAAAFDTHIAGSVMVTLGYPMQFDTRDTLMVRGAIELAQATEQATLYLTDANDVTHEGVSIAEAQAPLMEMMVAFAAAHAKKQELRAQIDAAQTVEDVEAVAW